MRLTFYDDNEKAYKLIDEQSQDSSVSQCPLKLTLDDEIDGVTYLPLKLKLDTKKDKQVRHDYNKLLKKYPSIKQKYNKDEIYSLIANIKQQQTHMIDKIAIEIGRKYMDNNLIKEISIKTNNPTLYWKTVMKEKQTKIRSRKADYQKCFAERGWNNSANLKPAKALNTNFGIGRK